MGSYQLVIWYCGSDAMDLYFWDGNDVTNPAVVNYLDSGGKLWLMGSGFLNDKYINTPLVFSSPFFVYDYLGIWQWFLETYSDDGGNGLPQLDISDENQVFTMSLETLNWSEPPEPWVDGCQATDDATLVYGFGPDSYVFSGYAGALYCTANDMNNLTFTFDPARLDSVGKITTLCSDVVAFYDEILDVGEGLTDHQTLAVYPNPATTTTTLSVHLQGEVSIKIMDLTGNMLRQLSLNNHDPNGFTAELSVSDLPGGIYFLRVENQQTVISRSLVVAR
jgi:hypothetical protein